MTETQEAMRQRLLLAGLGAVAGFVAWVLFDLLPDRIDAPRTLLTMAVAAAITFGGMLVMTGRITPYRAALFALPHGIAGAALMLWASFRFDTLEGFLSSGHPLAALFLLAALPIPFFLAAETSAHGWRDYEALFDGAWSLAVRVATAWAFTGLFWMVIFLSDQLLKLVGFRWLGELYDHVWIALPLTGLVLGLALAVLVELRRVVSTLRRLALQLLRLLLPLVAAVVALFIVLVPFQGLDRVFGELSAAATMLVMAGGAITLISSAVDGRDRDAAHSTLMVAAARVLSILLPLIALIAAYAIWVRVAAYGWTPARLGGAVVSGAVLAYALAYAAAVLGRTQWRAHVRRANTWMALALIAVSGLWLTPVLNAERISANSHLRLFMAGRIGTDDLDPWRMRDDWGRAGEAALNRLRRDAEAPDRAGVDALLARFDAGESWWQIHRDRTGAEEAVHVADLEALLPVRPEGAILPDGALAALPRGMAETIAKGCAAVQADGRPGCAAVIGSFDRNRDREAVILVYNVGPGAEAVTLERHQADEFWAYSARIDQIGDPLELMPDAIARILDGDFAFMPARRDALQIGETQILPFR
jgi:hypothetical protein